MTTYHLIINSKNKKSLLKFNTFLTKELFTVINKNLKIKSTKKTITLLTSPHVNKTAQEQFEYTTYYSKILVNIPNFRKFLIFMKKIQTNIFSDINMKIKHTTSKETYNKMFNPNNIKIGFFNKQSFKNEKYKKYKISRKKVSKVNYCVNFFDILGETNIKSLDSSVGRAKD
jgi:ribosomal protein S10